MYRNSIFKFVLIEERDLNEILEIVNRFDIPKEKVYLMPEGTDIEKLRERVKWLVDVCKQCKFNFSPRLQVDIWGNQRGV